MLLLPTRRSFGLLEAPVLRFVEARLVVALGFEAVERLVVRLAVVRGLAFAVVVRRLAAVLLRAVVRFLAVVVRLVAVRFAGLRLAVERFAAVRLAGLRLAVVRLRAVVVFRLAVVEGLRLAVVRLAPVFEAVVRRFAVEAEGFFAVVRLRAVVERLAVDDLRFAGEFLRAVEVARFAVVRLAPVFDAVVRRLAAVEGLRLAAPVVVRLAVVRFFAGLRLAVEAVLRAVVRFLLAAEVGLRFAVVRRFDAAVVLFFLAVVGRLRAVEARLAVEDFRDEAGEDLRVVRLAVAVLVLVVVRPLVRERVLDDEGLLGIT